MQVPRIFNLGELIVSDSVIADASMSKNALSQILGTSRPTVWRYDNVAFWNILDYKQEYPEFSLEERKKRKSTHDRQVLLTPYQSWVISAIQICFKFHKKEDSVKNYIQENSFVFNKFRYERRMRQVAEAAKSA